MRPRTWETLSRMGILFHTISQVKRTLPSRIIAEIIFAWQSTVFFSCLLCQLLTGPTSRKSRYEFDADNVPFEQNYDVSEYLARTLKFNIRNKTTSD